MKANLLAAALATASFMDDMRSEHLGRKKPVKSKAERKASREKKRRRKVVKASRRANR